MRHLVKAWALASLATCSLALLEERFVSFYPDANISQLGVSITDAPILVAQDDFVGVYIAANSLVKDLAGITGNATCSGITANKDLDVVIVAGSPNSSLIRALSDGGHLDTSDFEGKWETFKTTVVNLPGSAAAEPWCGQSPWHWFADVPAQKHAQIFAPTLNKTTVHGEPTVKYRGLFINDEELVLNTWWARQHNATRYPLDREFYAHVFDLTLRLKVNYLWPAM
ncbi:hypothetical protein VTI74DRAFT_1749 [Chaetomium olivicolor]